ncbi:MAG: TetR/AcrR family transcriptional regulator [Actinomycetota bacterium]
MSSAESARVGTRTERRRAATRARVVDAAERLMRDRGVDDVTVQDITEAADIGHGTFYLHFTSKGEVLRPVIERLAAPVAERIDTAAGGSTDPALRVALGVRLLLRAIAEDPLWSWYSRSGLSFSNLVADMGREPREDITNGLDSGRFDVDDVASTVSFIDGAIVGVVAALDEGAPVDELADTTAELMLRVLGIPADEAARLAHMPIDEPASTRTET